MMRFCVVALSLACLLCESEARAGWRHGFCFPPCVPDVKWERIRACDVVPKDPLEAKAQSSDVFLGTVKSIKRLHTNLLVTFDVQQTWKGDVGETVTIATPNSYAARGYTFHEGKDYLVYCQRAIQSHEIRVTSTLTRTQPAAVAQKDIDALDQDDTANEEMPAPEG